MTDLSLVPGWLILSRSFTDLAVTTPPMCFKKPAGNFVMVKNGNSWNNENRIVTNEQTCNLLLMSWILSMDMKLTQLCRYTLLLTADTHCVLLQIIQESNQFSHFYYSLIDWPCSSGKHKLLFKDELTLFLCFETPKKLSYRLGAFFDNSYSISTIVNP